MRWKTPSRPLAALAASLLLTLTSCGSSDSPADPDTPEPTRVSGTVGSAGGALTSSDGKLSIVFPPGALSSDTGITVSEIAVPTDEPQMGGFGATGALSMDPPGLQLSKPATLTWKRHLDVTTVVNKLGAERVPEGDKVDEFDLAIGVILDDDESIIPDQTLSYDINTGTLEIRLDYDYSGNTLVVGPPFQPDNPDPGNDLSKIKIFYRFPQLPVEWQTPFQLGLTWEGPDMSKWGFDGMKWDIKTPQWAEDTEPTDPVVTDGEENHTEYDVSADITAALEGLYTIESEVTADVTFGDFAGFDLPDNIRPAFGQYRIQTRLSSPTLSVGCASPPCELFDGTIETGMSELAGMSVNYVEANDIDPDSTGEQWLYITAKEATKAYRIMRNPNGSIRDVVERINILGRSEGVLAVSARDGSDIRRVLTMYGLGGASHTHWNDQAGDYGSILLIAGSIVHDAVAYGSLDQTFGYSYVQSTSVRFEEYNSQSGFFEGSASMTLTDLVAFEGSSGEPVSAFVNPVTDACLAVMDDGDIWFHDRVDPKQKGFKVGNTALDPRQIRGYGDVVGVTNHGSNSVSCFTWDGTGSIASIGNATVDEGPHSLDVMPLSNGNVIFVTTSETNSTYTLVEVNTQGIVGVPVPHPLPGGCAGAKFAVFVPGEQVYLAFSCGNSEVVALTVTPLDY